MQKRAYTICGFAVGASAFGFFFRWLQNQVAFEKDTGMLISGTWGIILLCFVAMVAGLIAVRVYNFKVAEMIVPETVNTAFVGKTKYFSIAAWAIGGLMALGGVITLLNLRGGLHTGLYTITALFAILTGVSFPIICNASKSNYSPGLVSVLMTFPIAMYVFWLIGSYMEHATDPTIWSFAIEILAIAACLVAFYYMAGYPYGRPRAFRCTFMGLFAPFLCLTSLSDERMFGHTVCFIATAAMLLMETWLIVENMQDAKPKYKRIYQDGVSKVVPADEVPEDAIEVPETDAK